MGQVISFISERLFGAKKTTEDRNPKPAEHYPPPPSYYVDINEEEHNLNKAPSFDSFHQHHHVVTIPPPPSPPPPPPPPQQAVLDPLAEADLHQPLIARSAKNWVRPESASIAASCKGTKEVIIKSVAEEATSSKTQRKKNECPKDELVRKIGPYKSNLIEDERNLNKASSFDSFHQHHHVPTIPPPQQPQRQAAVLELLAEEDLHQPLIVKSAMNWVEHESANIAACFKETPKKVIIESVAEEATSRKTNRKECPREEIVRKIGPYKSKHKILLVGEGDFSFSASLAVTFGDASNIVATSLDNKAFLRKNYKMAMFNIKELVNRGSCVIHGVDATQMSKHTSLKGMKFDRIIFNFPHTSCFGRTISDISHNQNLVLGFLRNAKKMIHEHGEIHVTHKTSRDYIKWNIVRLGTMEGLYLIDKSRFDPGVYPGYNTKYGLGGDKNFHFFPCNSYKFGVVCFA